MITQHGPGFGEFISKRRTAAQRVASKRTKDHGDTERHRAELSEEASKQITIKPEAANAHFKQQNAQTLKSIHGDFGDFCQRQFLQNF